VEAAAAGGGLRVMLRWYWLGLIVGLLLVVALLMVQR
jgi:hypothetical protein